MQEHTKRNVMVGGTDRAIWKELPGWYHVSHVFHPKIENLQLFILKMVSFRYVIVGKATLNSDLVISKVPPSSLAAPLVGVQNLTNLLNACDRMQGREEGTAYTSQYLPR